MFDRIKKILKKSESGFLALLGGFRGERRIREDEYVNFFVGRQYAAITAIADSLAGLNWRLANKKDQEIQHEYLEYITPELLQNIAIFIKMTGTAYVWKISNRGKILGLRILLPRALQAKINTAGQLLGWEYAQNNTKTMLDVEEVMVFAEFNPYQSYPHITRGYSPLQAIAMTIRGEKEIEKWNYAVLTNDTPP